LAVALRVSKAGAHQGSEWRGALASPGAAVLGGGGISASATSSKKDEKLGNIERKQAASR